MQRYCFAVVVLQSGNDLDNSTSTLSTQFLPRPVTTVTPSLSWTSSIQVTPVIPSIVPTRPSTTTTVRTTPVLLTQIFDCQLYIKNQANPSYNLNTSFEYQQASQMIFNAVSCISVSFFSSPFFQLSFKLTTLSMLSSYTVIFGKEILSRI